MDSGDMIGSKRPGGAMGCIRNTTNINANLRVSTSRDAIGARVPPALNSATKPGREVKSGNGSEFGSVCPDVPASTSFTHTPAPSMHARRGSA